MKKYFTIITFFLAVLALASCGDRNKNNNNNGEYTGKEKVITIDGGGDIGNFNTTAIMTPSEANPFPYNTLETLCKEWEKTHKGYRVQIQPTSAAGDRGVIVPQLNQKMSAQILYQSGTVINSDLNKGYYVDLTDALNGKNKYAPEYDSWLDLYSGEMLAASDGRYYMVQLERIPVGIMYNKKIFNALNLEVPTTYAEFLNTCQLLKQNGYDAYHTTYTWYDIVLESNIFSGIMDQVDVIRKDGKVDTEEMCRAYDKGIWNPSTDSEGAYYDYIRLCKEKTKYYPGYEDKSWQTYDAISSFATGKLAMIEATGREMRKLSVNKAIDFEWGVMTYPDLTTESSVHAAKPVVRGSAGLATSWFVTNAAEEAGTVDACIDLLQYLTAPEQNNKLIGDLKGGIPLNPSKDYELADYIEPLIDIYNSDMQAYKRDERVIWGAFCSWEVLGYDFNTFFIRTLQDVDNGVKNVPEAVASLSSQIKRTVAAQKIMLGFDTSTW